jgi:phage terminase large subunit
MLSDINIPTIFEWLPRSSIRDWNKQHKQLILTNGSEISFRSAEDPDKLRGIGLDWLWIDEASFVKSGLWEIIYPALTDKNGIAWITTTPKGYDWVHNTFYIPASKGDPDFEIWKYSTLDNPNIDKLMVAKARENLSPTMFRQEYEASFEKFEGLVYPEFSKDNIVENTKVDRDDLFFVGIDAGFTNPTAVVFMAEDHLHNIRVIDEIYETQMSIPQVCKLIKEHREALGKFTSDGRVPKIENYIIDPSTRAVNQQTMMSIKDQYIENGIPVIEGINDVRAGIDRVRQYLTGDAKLYVDGRCLNVIREFSNYVWDPAPKDGSNLDERPRKMFDHALDAIRYVIMDRPDWYTHVQRDRFDKIVNRDNGLVTQGRDIWSVMD